MLELVEMTFVGNSGSAPVSARPRLRHFLRMGCWSVPLRHSSPLLGELEEAALVRPLAPSGFPSFFAPMSNDMFEIVSFSCEVHPLASPLLRDLHTVARPC